VYLQFSNIHTYNKTTNDNHPVQRAYGSPNTQI